ncbi:unnamed protein product, partial [Rotaria sordida]
CWYGPPPSFDLMEIQDTLFCLFGYNISDQFVTLKKSIDYFHKYNRFIFVQGSKKTEFLEEYLMKCFDDFEFLSQNKIND